MTIASILETFSMEIDDQADGWFLDWVLRSPKEVSLHLTAGWHAYSSLTELAVLVNDAREYFGGMGAQAMMIDRLFSPHYHAVKDYSEDAVVHMKKVLPDCDVMQGDSYADQVLTADLVGLDFGDMTAWRTRAGEPHRRLMDQVFKRDPKAVVITDIAGPRLHLQRERYESLLGAGTCASYPSYLAALAVRLEALYGYTLHRGFYHRWSTVMSFVPEGGARTFAPTPDSPVGLELF